MEKKYEEDEFDQLINDQFIREAEIMKEALFSGDEDTEEYEVSEEEMKESYQKLMRRLKEEEAFREDRQIRNGQPEKEKNPEAELRNRVIPMRKKAGIRCSTVKVAGIAAIVGMCVFGAGMTIESNMGEAAERMEHLIEGDSVAVYAHNAESLSAYEKEVEI